MPYNNREYQYKYIVTATTTTVFTGRGTLHNITLNSVANGVTRIVDNTAGTVANVGIISAAAGAGTYSYDAAISKGLIIDTAGTGDMTVTFTQG